MTPARVLVVGAGGFIGRAVAAAVTRRGHRIVPADRDPGTLALTLAAVAQGIQIHRVHDVAGTRQGLSLWQAVEGTEI